MNYLKIAVRSLWKAKAHSFINILGLSLGILCCILISLFVVDEWTFDRFHSGANKIYRVYAKEDWGENQQFFNTNTPFPMGPTLKENFEEVEKQVRFSNVGTQVKIGDHLFNEKISIAGQDFFDVFDFELTVGDRGSVLQDQSSVVITESLARKYFGDQNPINQTISMQLNDKFEDFTIRAIAKNLPTNSSIQFDILISDLNYPKLYNERVLTSAWFNINPETYVLLAEGTDPKVVESKFPSVFKTILGDDYEKSKYAPGLQPLTSIHLDDSYPAGIAPVSNPKYSYILAAIALLILVVACINFVTLSIGQSMKRAREVGIRKVAGAHRGQLITQFVGEAVLITLISLLIGWAASFLLLPQFNDLSGKQLIFPFNGMMLTVLLGLLVTIGLFAGSYPALILSAFGPSVIFKGIQSGQSKQLVRKVLVGVQLVLSIFLISSTMIMQNQLKYLRDKDIGFNKSQLIVIPLNVPPTGRLPQRINAGFELAQKYKTEFSKLNGISSACTSSHDFGGGAWTDVGYTDDKGSYKTFKVNTIDDQYITSLAIKLKQGRNFSDSNPSDKRRSIIVNEAFVKEYGWENAIGKRIPGKNFPDHEVIGVVEDFNYSSLYTKVEPLVLVQDPLIILPGIENINFQNDPLPKLIVRLMPENISQTIDQIKDVWASISGGEEFTFSFVDQALAAQYESDQNLGRIVRIATLLSILIGGLGLYGLASLTLQSRTKEVSIRKVLGASEGSLLALLSREYVLLIIICLVLSVPFTIYLMQSWLTTFEYRITIGWQIFLFSGGISLLIAMLAIGYRLVVTMRAQPAEMLKCE